MRKTCLAAMLWCAHVVACGGAQTDRGGAKSAPTGTSGPALPNDVVRDGAEGTTTTTALAEAGKAPGQTRKLTDARDTTTPASAVTGARATAAPHAHEAGRGPEDIRAIIVAHRDEARACYDQALRAHPEMEGDLVLQWTIDPQGNVTRASTDPARSQILDPTVAGCIANRIKRIRFAPSPGGFETNASYPFNFHPRLGDRAPK